MNSEDLVPQGLEQQIIASACQAQAEADAQRDITTLKNGSCLNLEQLTGILRGQGLSEEVIQKTLVTYGLGKQAQSSALETQGQKLRTNLQQTAQDLEDSLVSIYRAFVATGMDHQFDSAPSQGYFFTLNCTTESILFQVDYSHSDRELFVTARSTSMYDIIHHPIIEASSTTPILFELVIRESYNIIKRLFSKKISKDIFFEIVPNENWLGGREGYSRAAVKKYGVTNCPSYTNTRTFLEALALKQEQFPCYAYVLNELHRLPSEMAAYLTRKDASIGNVKFNPIERTS